LLALSLHQPWATLVAHGLKRCETRSWRWPSTGPALPAVIAVHATIGMSKAQRDLCVKSPFSEALTECGVNVAAVYTDGCHPSLPRGAVVALARVGACWPAERVGPWSKEAAFGDYTPGRWAWVFDACYRLAKPVPAVGRHKLWKWSPDYSVERLDLVRVYGPPEVPLG
jgi:hypothetical protein